MRKYLGRVIYTCSSQCEGYKPYDIALGAKLCVLSPTNITYIIHRYGKLILIKTRFALGIVLTSDVVNANRSPGGAKPFVPMGISPIGWCVCSIGVVEEVPHVSRTGNYLRCCYSRTRMGFWRVWFEWLDA